MAKKTPKLPKPQKPPEPEPPPVKTKGKPNATANPPNEPTAAQPPPKPKTLVAPASWTGKLPVTLLHEHCQKLGWNKVEYSMKNERSGFLATAILAWKNPKTNEVETVRFTPPTPEGYKPTAVEARHQCAVYALHRIASHKNLQHVLPPEHRIFWQHLETVRKQDMQLGRDYLYQPDPFLAKKQREARLQQLESQRAEAEAQKRADEEKGILISEGKDKKWEASPIVEMGLETRRMVEQIIRQQYRWSRHGVKQAEKVEIVSNLSSIGFRNSHVEEACEYAKDSEEALEWLLIHVPEDDLPPRFLPRDYATGVSILAPSQVTLALNLAAERLAKAGYPIEGCREVLLDVNGDEIRASEVLLRQLLGVEDSKEEMAEDDDVWAEEQEPIKEILSSRFVVVDPSTCRIQLLPPNSTNLPRNITIEFRKPSHYPNGLPPHMVVLSEPKLPSHVRLSLLRQAGMYAWESLRGVGMVYSLSDWIEENIGRIVAHPGRLTDLDGVTTGETVQTVSQTVAVGKKPSRKTRGIDWTPGTSIAQKPVPEFRKALPAWKHRDEVVRITRDNRVTVVTGETGSGKSTQIPQFLLDDHLIRGLSQAVNIVCTQPRRISAIGLAERVSDERSEKVGATIGYSIRGETKSSRDTKLQFVTTGVLLRRFLDNAELADISHVIVDEVHERTVDGDFLLLLLKQLLSRRKDFNVILMSATVEAETFVNYFSDFSVGRIHVEGRTFPVQDIYLESILRFTGYRPPMRKMRRDRDEDEFDEYDEGFGAALKILNEGILDYDLIAKTVQHVCASNVDNGGILIFLPGIVEISRCITAIKNACDSQKLSVLPLHASLPSHEQTRVFAKPPPGTRKVVVATNVAETSITIDDITVVIDTGKVKQLMYAPETNLVCLVEQWTSRASAKQRRGRAGRVTEGTCFKLFSKKVEQNKMDEVTTPEIQRIPLEQLCLSVLGMGLNDVIGVLRKTLSPPKTEALKRAMQTLKDVGALDDDSLSALGRHLAAIPADLRLSKLMVLGSVFGSLSVTLTIASILSGRGIFLSPHDKREAATDARKKFDTGSGDLLTATKAFEVWNALRKDKGTSVARRWCEENFLSFSSLLEIASTRASYVSALYEAGLIPGTTPADVSKLSTYSNDDALVRALVASALYPNIGRIVLPATKYEKLSSGSLALDPEARAIKFFTASETSNDRDERVFIHPSSTLFSANSFVDNSLFVAFFNRVQTSKIFLRDVTPASSLAILLLCGDKVEIDHLGRGVRVGGLRMKAWARIGTLIGILRRLLDLRLTWKFEKPNMDVSSDVVIDCLRKLIDN